MQGGLGLTGVITRTARQEVLVLAGVAAAIGLAAAARAAASFSRSGPSKKARAD